MIFLFRLLRRLFTFLLLLIIVVPGYFAYSIWNEGHRAHPVKSDAIVVLGAAQFNGVPSDILQSRIDEAARIFKQGYAPRIMFYVVLHVVKIRNDMKRRGGRTESVPWDPVGNRVLPRPGSLEPLDPIIRTEDDQVCVDAAQVRPEA